MDIAAIAESFRCYDCEEDECDQPEERLPTCKNAIYCWKSTNREKDGTIHYNRGCISTYMAMRFPCISKGDSRYQIECCQTEFCNSGAFPTLEPIVFGQVADPAVLIVAAAMSLIVMILIAFAILMYCSPCMSDQTDASEAIDQASRRAGSRNVAGLELNVTHAGGRTRRRKEHNQPTEITSETNNEALQPTAGPSNVAGVCSNSSLEEVEINVTPAGDSTLKGTDQQREEHNPPTEIDSETNNEASPPADSSNVAGTCSNSPLEQPKLIVTPPDDNEGVLSHESHGSNQKDASET